MKKQHEPSDIVRLFEKKNSELKVESVIDYSNEYYVLSVSHNGETKFETPYYAVNKETGDVNYFTPTIDDEAFHDQNNVVYKRGELTHFGILGMKWGVRRYQNKDGSLTNLGKKRYGLGSGNERDTLRNLLLKNKKIGDNVRSIPVSKRSGNDIGVERNDIRAQEILKTSKEQGGLNKLIQEAKLDESRKREWNAFEQTAKEFKSALAEYNKEHGTNFKTMPEKYDGYSYTGERLWNIWGDMSLTFQNALGVNTRYDISESYGKGLDDLCAEYLKSH